MQSMNNKIEEKYIKIIARELAKALKAVHDADIIHRDVKGE
jgi:serine/threonine protein kinase